jgi:hypothetical protein
MSNTGMRPCAAAAAVEDRAAALIHQLLCRVDAFTPHQLAGSSRNDHPAVDWQNLARHHAGIVTGEIERRTGDIVGPEAECECKD